MKTNHRQMYTPLWSLLCLIMLTFMSCNDKEWSENYDIEWPVTTIESVQPLSAPVESILTVTGTNLDFTYIFRIGSFECVVLEKTATQLKVQVPASVTETSTVSVYNLYRRNFEFSEKFTPIPSE
ncbi:MAG: IPT/TIG domain-containing protein [Tannerellaceae bacterium]|nr:IPT/TIG domain-containing protein [Tannerellaceae bacterium]